MLVRQKNLAVVIGASETAEALRRRLRTDGVRIAVASGPLRGLRRALVTHEHGPVILCVSLDALTLDRFGTTLTQLLDDARHLPGCVPSVGVLDPSLPLPMVTHVGCDVYAASAADVRALLAALAEWDGRRTASQLVSAHVSRFSNAVPHGRIGELTPADDMARLLAPHHWHRSRLDRCGDPDAPD